MIYIKNQYLCRLDNLSNLSEDAFVELALKCFEGVDQLAYVFELGKQGDNPHLHLYFRFPPTDKLQKYTKRIQKFVGTGNKAYATKKMDPQQLEEIDRQFYPLDGLAYMFKHGEPTFINIPISVMERARKRNEEVQQQIRDRKNKTKNRFETYKKYILDTFKPDPKHPIHYQTLCSLTMQYFLDNDLMIRKFLLQSYVDTIYARYGYDDQWLYDYFDRPRKNY